MSRLGIHWAWVPAGVVMSVGSWVRFGPLVTGLLVAAGLAIGGAIRWRASRRDL